MKLQLDKIFLMASFLLLTGCNSLIPSPKDMEMEEGGERSATEIKEAAESAQSVKKGKGKGKKAQKGTSGRETQRKPERVSVSNDGKLTIESGSTSSAGGDPVFWSAFKIVNEKGETHTIDMKDSPLMSDIQMVTKKDGSVYYLVKCQIQMGSSEVTEWLQAYRIEGDTVRRVSVIDSSEDYKTVDRAHFETTYWVYDWETATNGAGSKWVLEYDSESRKLYVPQTDKHNYYLLNDRYHVWQFNGRRFVDKGVQAHKQMHRSLNRYVCLLTYFTTQDYTVRVDSLENGQLRLAAWQKPKKMAEKPDVLLKGGVRKSFPFNKDGYQPKDQYVFHKEGREYIADYEELTKDRKGVTSGRDYLLIRENGKTVLKQEKVHAK